MVWMQIASAGFSAYSKYKAAQNQANADEAAYQRNRQNAAVAQNLKIAQLNTRMVQEGEAAEAKKQALDIAALKKTEASKLASLESGLSGSSIDRTNAQFEIQRLRGTDVINQNTENLRYQIEMEKRGVSAETLSRINSLPRGQQPDFMSYAVPAALQAGVAYQTSLDTSVASMAARQVAVDAQVAKIVAGNEAALNARLNPTRPPDYVVGAEFSSNILQE